MSHIKKVLDVKVAVIADRLTEECFSYECRTVNITPWNYRAVFKIWRPDFLFVESAWEGHRRKWKYKIATYQEFPARSNHTLRKVVAYARDLGIRTVFWNREDGVHFERFIDSAQSFDHVFTVDSNYVGHYQKLLPDRATVQALPFAAQPLIHSFSGFNFKYNRANFVGSYSHHIHDQRRARQDMLFKAADSLGITIFDRNSKRKSHNYRYPQIQNMEIKPAVPYAATAKVYKDYLVSLNVNTVEDSPTMFSRRLVEILACGGIAVTTPAKSVDSLFKEYCHIVENPEDTAELFGRLRNGPSSDDLERARAGAEHVLQKHTWSHRLTEVIQAIGL